MKKTISCLALAAAALVWSAPPAQAAKYDGYLCGVSYVPYNTAQYGKYGRIFAVVMSAPDCGGTHLASLYFCSSAATSGSCALNYLNDEPQILALHQSLLSAMQQDTHVLVSTDTTCGVPSSCGIFVEFQAIP